MLLSLCHIAITTQGDFLCDCLPYVMLMLNMVFSAILPDLSCSGHQHEFSFRELWLHVKVCLIVPFSYHHCAQFPSWLLYQVILQPCACLALSFLLSSKVAVCCMLSIDMLQVISSTRCASPFFLSRSCLLPCEAMPHDRHKDTCSSYEIGMHQEKPPGAISNNCQLLADNYGQ